MELISHPIFKEHDTGMHPENKKRLDALGELPVSDISFDESVLKIIHDEGYINMVKDYSKLSKSLDGDTHSSPKSYEAAVYAANATIKASEEQGFALVRPPGHHAYPNRASGFCLFNNVSIAARRLANQGKRVLIFDFDGHLGDGTSAIFNDTDQVMYWSIHQFPAFPGHGSADEIGTDKGAGFTINVPLPPGSGDDIYANAIKYTLPIALEFNPDVVAVSAGFDAHQYDLLLDLRLTVDAFYNTGNILADNFSNVFATLEGGYNVEELPKSIYNFRDGISGNSKKYSELATESAIQVWMEYEMRLDKLLSNLTPYWSI
ncbi:histone deacetylase [Flavobacteriaceae bacterium D16]|nr:histone deacetylase [Flavobacteriaceae bacterium D16]